MFGCLLFKHAKAAEKNWLKSDIKVAYTLNTFYSRKNNSSYRIADKSARRS